MVGKLNNMLNGGGSRIKTSTKRTDHTIILFIETTAFDTNYLDEDCQRKTIIMLF